MSDTTETKAQETTEIKPAETLQEKLKRVTARKEPGNIGTTEKIKSFWETSDDDFEKEATPAAAEKKEEKKPEEIETQPATEELTEKIKNAAASTAVGALNVAITAAFVPAQNWKLKRTFKKRFTEDETALIESKLGDADLDDLEDLAEIMIKKRFENIQKKYLKKVNAVPLNESEKKEFHAACYNYQEITGKSLPPGLFLGLSIAQIFGARVIDVITD